MQEHRSCTLKTTSSNPKTLELNTPVRTRLVSQIDQKAQHVVVTSCHRKHRPAAAPADTHPVPTGIGTFSVPNQCTQASAWTAGEQTAEILDNHRDSAGNGKTSTCVHRLVGSTPNILHLPRTPGRDRLGSRGTSSYKVKAYVELAYLTSACTQRLSSRTGGNRS
jgi:hypothetical protein